MVVFPRSREHRGGIAPGKRYLPRPRAETRYIRARERAPAASTPTTRGMRGIAPPMRRPEDTGPGSAGLPAGADAGASSQSQKSRAPAASMTTTIRTNIISPRISILRRGFRAIRVDAISALPISYILSPRTPNREVVQSSTARSGMLGQIPNCPFRSVGLL